MEYATTSTRGPEPRTTVTPTMHTLLQAIRDRSVSCFHCSAPAILLRSRVGRAVPLCRAHARHAPADLVDREIAAQRARAATMRRR